jgi:hypothetical protein
LGTADEGSDSPRNVNDRAALVAVLKSIVELWPKHASDDITSARSRLQAYLADGFDPMDLLNRVTSVARVRRIVPSSTNAVIYFYDVDEILQRAVFELAKPSKWRLASLKFQCPVCFGGGMNDDEKCIMCGGSGWGASAGVRLINPA